MLEEEGWCLPTVTTVAIWSTRIVFPPDDVTHRVASQFYLLNFILDGHHKMMAAAELGKPIGVLSFVSPKVFELGNFVTDSVASELLVKSVKPTKTPLKIVYNLPTNPPYCLAVGV